MELDLFIGRFHPVVVHLPIGFLIGAVLFELYDVVSDRQKNFHFVVMANLGAGLLTAILAVVSGFMLAEETTYASDQLDAHRFSGFATLILTAVILASKFKIRDYPKWVSWLGSLLLIVPVSTTGHLGGSLTHGDAYLVEYAPEFMRRIVGIQANETVDLSSSDPDSLWVYPDLIVPVLKTRCTSCHNPDKTSGGLDLTSYGDLFVQAETGLPVLPGKPGASELFHRVSIPVRSKKFMPPRGEPLSYTELTLLKYWIQTGADSMAHFDKSQMNPELVELLRRDYQLDLVSRPYYEKVQVEKLEASQLTQLGEQGFDARYLGEENYLLSIRAMSDSITDMQLNVLKSISTITFLDVANCHVATWEFLSGMRHLTRLDLHNTNVQDADLQHLIPLRFLTSINLYETAITYDGIKKIAVHPGLERIYLWETQVTEQELEQLHAEFPGIEFITQFTFTQPSSP